MSRAPLPPDIGDFERRESAVRSYCRSFPTVFARAKGALVSDESGREYIDFFAGAGTLNYGHNPDFIKERLLAYLAADGITHGLDFYTSAKRAFIRAFAEHVLQPKGLDYKLQFCGPTGANAIEVALKLARRVTGRSGVFSFIGAYHGLSLGSLAVTGNRSKRGAAGTALHDVTFVPYPDGGVGGDDDGSFGLAYIERLFTDTHSGVELPAAVLVETVQAEGGVNVAPGPWLQRLRELCTRHGVLLVCDDIQVGCFRTGPFFSFERAGIVPDIVTLSKAISGYGLPMSLVLLKPELDIWKPGEHTGTFRGNQLAFVGGEAALAFAAQIDLPARVAATAALMQRVLRDELASLAPGLAVRGTGMIWGLDCAAVDPTLAARTSRRCFESGLVIETAGRHDTVLKFLPPLTIEHDMLLRGLATVRQALQHCLRG